MNNAIKTRDALTRHLNGLARAQLNALRIVNSAGASEKARTVAAEAAGLCSARVELGNLYKRRIGR